MEASAAGELLTFALGLAAAGALAGLLAGVFGIGGGAILVPVIDQILDVLGYDDSVRMHVAVGTSLAIIIPTAIRSFNGHRARGAVDMALIRGWVVAVPLGVVAAAAVAAFISGDGLRAVFTVMAAVVASKLLFRWERVRLGPDIPGNPVKAVWGAAIGFVSTLMGVGGGVISNTFMTLYGRPIHQAVATSSGVGVLIAIPGALGYVLAGFADPLLPPLSLGYVNLIGVALVIPLSMLCAPVGVRLAHAASKRQLEISFGIFLLAVSARFAWSILANGS